MTIRPSIGAQVNLSGRRAPHVGRAFGRSRLRDQIAKPNRAVDPLDPRP